jgi:hypothetical protein
MKEKRPAYKILLISAAASILMLAAGLLFIEAVTPATAWDELGKPLFRLCLFIGIGLAVAQAIEAKGWSRRMGVLARPLFSFANLGDRCSASFSAAFFSGVAANAILVDFYKEGKISKEQVFLTNFMNHFPAYFLHLPTTFFIVVPLTGAAGLLYFALTFSALLLRTAGFAVYGRLKVRPVKEEAFERAATERPEKNGKSVWQAIRERLPTRYSTILTYVLPIYIAVYLVNALGAFDLVRDWMAETFTVGFVPVEALSVVILSFVAEFSSGFAAAGALLDQGVITVKQTVIALIIGNIIAFPMRALRHQLPRYMGIFQPKMGMEILLLGQGLRVASLVVVTVIFYLMV